MALSVPAHARRRSHSVHAILAALTATAAAVALTVTAQPLAIASTGPGDFRGPPTGKIAFTELPSSDESTIWTVERDGTGARALTSGALDSEPKFSPTGRQISYLHQLPPDPLGGGGVSEIWVMNSDGSNQHSLTPVPAQRTFGAHEWEIASANLRWSADGHEVILRGDTSDSPDQFEDLYAVDASTLEWRPLNVFQAPCDKTTGMDLSPGGHATTTRTVYEPCEQPDVPAQYVVDVDGTVVTFDPAADAVESDSVATFAGDNALLYTSLSTGNPFTDDATPLVYRAGLAGGTGTRLMDFGAPGVNSASGVDGAPLGCGVSLFDAAGPHMAPGQDLIGFTGTGWPADGPGGCQMPVSGVGTVGPDGTGFKMLTGTGGGLISMQCTPGSCLTRMTVQVTTDGIVGGLPGDPTFQLTGALNETLQLSVPVTRSVGGGTLSLTLSGPADWPLIAIDCGGLGSVNLATGTVTLTVVSGDDIGCTFKVGNPGTKDSDGDGFSDAVDNCSSVPNPDQADLDRDGLGDACDPDIDGDGQANAVDPCPNDATNSCIAPTGTPVYVAMGDSFSSGEGACDPGGKRKHCQYDPATRIATDLCHRSLRAYGPTSVLASTLGFSLSRFVACSGAVVDDFYRTHPDANRHNEGLQIAKLAAVEADPDRYVAAVTLSVGGNDLGFSSIVAKCLAESRIFNLFCSDGYSIMFADGKLLAALQARLEVLYGDILRAAPRAQVYVMGYPRLFAANPSGHTGTNNHQDCDFHPEDALWFNVFERDGDNTIRLAVDRVANSRLHFVDAYYAFDGHGLCRAGISNFDRSTWVNTVLYGKSGTVHHVVFQESFHPNAAGQAALKNALNSCVGKVESGQKCDE